MSDNAPTRPPSRRRVALVTGAGGRTINIGAAVARRLAETGWDVAFTYWRPYDDDKPWAPEPEAPAALGRELAGLGARCTAVEADLADPAVPATVFDAAEHDLGPVHALVMCHCEQRDLNLLTTTVESFDRHFAVNARAPWLLIREFGRRFAGAADDSDPGRIIAFTGDHVVGNLPYGASKGALDRITLAAAHEFAALGVRANVINPGPVDTGWMTDEVRPSGSDRTPAGRLAGPEEPANLVAFLCSPQGQWINGQLLYSNGGFRTAL
ncbi:SDR family oxidoreductase [Streptomyces sp. B6B3]|uniref:SDR family oxidoreductase n=1 Tax=Streptomyces sp. B6B3 TaxID=3153570 RepID=UPI00325F78D6